MCSQFYLFNHKTTLKAIFLIKAKYPPSPSSLAGQKLLDGRHDRCGFFYCA